MELYNKAIYYEIAFGFVDSKKQVDLFEQYIKKFSKIKAKRFLDIGCGHAPQLRELAKRGYETIGLDLSRDMLNYLYKSASAEGVKIETLKADFHHFRLKKPVDFAFIMVGTINYQKDNQDFLDHLDSVAGSLKKGGLYLIENFWTNWPPEREKWSGKRDGIVVKNDWSFKMTDTLNQLGTEYWTMKVNDNGKKYVTKQVGDRKVIMPQELVALVELNGKFEFLGFFEHSKIKRLERSGKDSDNNFVVLRKKG